MARIGRAGSMSQDPNLWNTLNEQGVWNFKIIYNVQILKKQQQENEIK